jgi:hypothetical protein
MPGVMAASLMLLGCSPAIRPSTVPPAPATSDFAGEHAAAVATNPAGVTLTVRPAGGRDRFVEGERIVLELAFSSTHAGTYELDMGTHDRSGRLWSETFRFDPADKVVDPLADYFGELGGPMGGIRPMPAKLSEQPTTVEVVLNEWARFGSPGTYRLFVRSTRVSPAAPKAATASNVVEIEIVSDPAWANRELARIEGILEKSTDREARLAARTALRFLTTARAARAMVDDLCAVPGKDDVSRWPTQAGLFGSPHRADVIALMEKGLTAPECAVGPGYLHSVARLRSAGQTATDAHARATEAALTTLIEGLPKKSDDARATSLYTALAEVAERRDPKPDPRTEALRHDLARVLGKLPEPALVGLLGYQWPMVRSTALASPLLALASEARPQGGLLQSVSDLALERLIELDYDRAKTFILAEIARPGGARLSFSGATLGLLKDAELPNLDGALVSGLKAPERDGISLGQRAELFARYASQAVLEEAWAAYKEVPYFRISLLKYLARHDPKAAEAEITGMKDFDSLNRLSRFLYDAMVEALVIERLETQDAIRATSLLAERGTAAAEKALWARLESLDSATPDRRQVADALRSAITRGRGWMTPPDKLRALADLCPDPECKQQVALTTARWGEGGKRPALVLWSTQRTGQLFGWLAHYHLHSVAELQARVAQLPPGITLEWQTKPADVDAALMDDLRKRAKARQVEIVARP